jgi:catechol 2,3-dioxygenase-like lactoylglutathione lyase family enzyme
MTYCTIVWAPACPRSPDRCRPEEVVFWTCGAGACRDSEEPQTFGLASFHDPHITAHRRSSRRPIAGHPLGLRVKAHVRSIVGQVETDPARTTESVGPASTPTLLGFHHVRLPCSDVFRSRDWYTRVLGLEPLLVFEDEDQVTGLVLTHEHGLVIGVHLDPERVVAFRGFPVLGLSVDDVVAWCSYLDELGVEHSEIMDGHLGSCVQLADPDGLVIELQTVDQPSAYET